MGASATVVNVSVRPSHHDETAGGDPRKSRFELTISLECNATW